MGTQALSSKPASAGLPAELLADALFTSTQQRVLGLLFGQPDRSFFVTELIELAGMGRGAVQRELLRLERSGLISARRHGNQKHYQANPATLIFEALCTIINMTLGVPEQVRRALEPLLPKLSLVLIFGSVAKRSDTASSNIDLLAVSDELTLEDLYALFSETEKGMGRQINPTLYSQAEFNKCRADGNVFLKRVLEGPTLLLAGELHGN